MIKIPVVGQTFGIGIEHPAPDDIPQRGLSIHDMHAFSAVRYGTYRKTLTT
jgi:hypothetical protein